MRNNDQIILEKIYLKSKQILNEKVDDIFQSEVELDIYFPEEIFDINKPKSVTVWYAIEPEYRSYGIKEINTSFISANPFSI